ncbi:MAG: hypothetical protein AAGJ29_05745 [Pseudomonadota bacterium]
MSLPSMKSTALLALAMALAGCGSTGNKFDHDFQAARLLGGATTQNIATQSIRPVDLPNTRGLEGQSGVRAVSAIARLNSGEVRELSDQSASGIGSEFEE